MLESLCNMYYVYFLQSQKDKSYYVGSTSDLKKRLKDHNSGKTTSTKPKLPLVLSYYEAYETKFQARKREIEIKKNWAAKEQVLARIKEKQAPSSSG